MASFIIFSTAADFLDSSHWSFVSLGAFKLCSAIKHSFSVGRASHGCSHAKINVSFVYELLHVYFYIPEQCECCFELKTHSFYILRSNVEVLTGR